MASSAIADEVIKRLLGADSTEELYEYSLEASMQVLDADTCQLIRIDDGDLEVLARTSQTDDTDEGVPVATDVIGQLDLIGRSHVFDDIRDVRSISAQQTDLTEDRHTPRSLLVVPVDSTGLLVATDETPGAFSATDQEWAEQLASFLDGIIEGRQRPDEESFEVNRLNQIARILSHDFAGPLTVARGSLELAQETGEDEYFERTRRAIDQIEQLVEGIERLADAGENYPEPAMVELRSVAEEVWPAIDHGDATLEIEDSRAILADEHALAQLLQNLFSNAIHHGGDDVTIQIGTTDDGFYVEDDGPGIPQEDREVVFSWGYSSGDDQKGIGLSIVEQIAEAHGWDIAIEDGDLGGARFGVTGLTESS